MVYVINHDGKPLMPCKPVIARLLLKQGKAKVIKENTMIKFEEHEGQLFRMLEEPVPLTADAKMPCIIVPIQDDSPMGKYVKQCWGHNEIFMRGKYTICGINADMVKVGFLRETPLSIHMFEIIGTFVKEGSADWALYQMMQGNKVRNRDWDGGLHEKSLLYCQLIGETIKHNEGCSALDVCLSDWEAPYIKNTGWQIYKEPKPESQYKVGDWVKCKDLAGVPAQCKVLEIRKHNVILECTTGHIWLLPHNNIIRKLSPSEIIVTIGCLSGTIAKSCDPNYFLMLHSRPATDCNHSMIRFSAIDKETRSLVESLLKAQKEVQE